MTPKDALNLLDQAVAQVNTNRQSHIALVQALETLKKVIEPAAPVEEPKKEE